MRIEKSAWHDIDEYGFLTFWSQDSALWVKTDKTGLDFALNLTLYRWSLKYLWISPSASLIATSIQFISQKHLALNTKENEVKQRWSWISIQRYSPLSPILVSLREDCEDGGSDDDKDIEAAEEADEEANTDLAGAALENTREVLARPPRVCSCCRKVLVAPGLDEIGFLRF